MGNQQCKNASQQDRFDAMKQTLQTKCNLTPDEMNDILMKLMRNKTFSRDDMTTIAESTFSMDNTDFPSAMASRNKIDVDSDSDSENTDALFSRLSSKNMAPSQELMLSRDFVPSVRLETSQPSMMPVLPSESEGPVIASTKFYSSPYKQSQRLSTQAPSSRLSSQILSDKLSTQVPSNNSLPLERLSAQLPSSRLSGDVIPSTRLSSRLSSDVIPSSRLSTQVPSARFSSQQISDNILPSSRLSTQVPLERLSMPQSLQENSEPDVSKQLSSLDRDDDSSNQGMVGGGGENARYSRYAKEIIKMSERHHNAGTRPLVINGGSHEQDDDKFGKITFESQNVSLEKIAENCGNMSQRDSDVFNSKKSLLGGNMSSFTLTSSSSSSDSHGDDDTSSASDTDSSSSDSYNSIKFNGINGYASDSSSDKKKKKDKKGLVYINNTNRQFSDSSYSGGHLAGKFKQYSNYQ